MRYNYKASNETKFPLGITVSNTQKRLLKFNLGSRYYYTLFAFETLGGMLTFAFLRFGSRSIIGSAPSLTQAAVMQTRSTVGSEGTSYIIGISTPSMMERRPLAPILRLTARSAMASSASGVIPVLHCPARKASGTVWSGRF